MTHARAARRRRAAILQVIGDAIGVDPAYLADVPDTAMLDDLTIAGIEIDSLDVLLFIAEVEYHFQCEVELPPGDALSSHTWGEFLHYVEGTVQASQERN